MAVIRIFFICIKGKSEGDGVNIEVKEIFDKHLFKFSSTVHF